MSWNYRILKKYMKRYKTTIYGLYEVYYDENGKPNGCTKSAMDLDGFEHPTDLIADLEMMLKDAKKHKEILNYEDF